MKYYKYLIFLVVVFGVVVWNYSYTKQTSAIGQESSSYKQGYSDYRYEAVDKHNKAVYDIDSLIKFTTGTYQDSLYKSALKCRRLRPDTLFGGDSLYSRVIKMRRARMDTLNNGDTAFARVVKATLARPDSVISTAVKSTRMRTDSLIVKRIGLSGNGGAGIGTLDSLFLADSSGTTKDTLILKVMGKVVKIFCDIGGAD